MTLELDMFQLFYSVILSIIEEIVRRHCVWEKPQNYRERELCKGNYQYYRIRNEFEQINFDASTF